MWGELTPHLLLLFCPDLLRVWAAPAHLPPPHHGSFGPRSHASWVVDAETTFVPQSAARLEPASHQPFVTLLALTGWEAERLQRVFHFPIMTHLGPGVMLHGWLMQKLHLCLRAQHLEPASLSHLWRSCPDWLRGWVTPAWLTQIQACFV